MYVFLQRVIWAHFDALWSYDRPIATNCSPNSIGFSAICTGNRQYLQLSEMTRIIIIDTFSILWYGHIMTCISPWETFQRMYTVLLTKIYRCCRQNLQTLICSQRMELVAASGKPVCWGTRRRGALGCSRRRSGTKCGRWTPTAGLGWRQALELIRKHKRSVRKAKTAKNSLFNHTKITMCLACRCS